MPDEAYHILGFDPPSTINLGWSCFRVCDGVASVADSGIEIIPRNDDVRGRLLHIESFILSLFDRFPYVRAIVMERSIGGGWAPTRENLAEATGVIKLIGAHRGVEFIAIHTGQMAKEMTGSATRLGKKSRLKRVARDTFFPEAKTFIEIASYIDDKGQRVEFFEHQSDALLLGAHHLLSSGVTVHGPGGPLEFVPPTRGKKRKRTEGEKPEEGR